MEGGGERKEKKEKKKKRRGLADQSPRRVNS